MMAQDIMEVSPIIRHDKAPEDRKRIELHAHTTMSQMDAVVSASNSLDKLQNGVTQRLQLRIMPMFKHFLKPMPTGKKHGVKVIFGLEANLVDDGVPIVFDEQHRKLEDDTYVVFDVETTGLSAVYDTIIELAAVRLKNGELLIRSNGLPILIIHYLQRRRIDRYYR